MFVPLVILLIAGITILLGLFFSHRSPHSDSRSFPYDRSPRNAPRGLSEVRGRGTQRRHLEQTYHHYRFEPRASFLSWAGLQSSVSSRSLYGSLLILATFVIAGFWLWARVFSSSPTILQQQYPDAAASASPPASTSTPSINQQLQASKVLARVSQLDPQQYNSTQEYNTWAYSACSAAAMTEVINSYQKANNTGKQYRITDILSTETSVHAITPDLGLLEPLGIDRTVSRFGFQTSWLNKPSIQDLVRIGNSGRPIIISFPPDRWSGGHLLVARGGNDTSVYLADSSRLNMQVMDYKTFNKYWAGFAVVVTPNNQK